MPPMSSGSHMVMSMLLLKCRDMWLNYVKQKFSMQWYIYFETSDCGVGVVTYSARSFQSGSSRLQKPHSNSTFRSIGRHHVLIILGGPQP